MNQEDWSLYNITIDKMKRVREYIMTLEPNILWAETKKNSFNSIIEKALSTNNANSMLEIIGYHYKERPTIYNKID